DDESGVDLMKASPRGVTLTAEGKLCLDEVRGLLKRADESVEKVRALARGEYGELHIGYAPSPTVEILPPALAAFQKTVPRVKVLLQTSPVMNSSPDCKTPRWNSRSWSINPMAGRPQASSLNCCVLTRCA